MRKLLFPSLYAAVFVLLFILLDQIIRKVRYQKADEAGKIRILWGRNIRILKSMGLRIGPAETLSEFRDRAEKVIPEDSLSFIGTYEALQKNLKFFQIQTFVGSQTGGYQV